MQDASYHMTALAYLTSHAQDASAQQLDDLMLLSYALQLLMRLEIEQQLHMQNSLRKVVTDEYVSPLVQFLQALVAQLVIKVNEQSVTALVAQYYRLQVSHLFEQARCREQKQYDYQSILEFKLFHFVEFHVGLGCSECVGGLKKVLQIAGKIYCLQK